MRRGCDGGSIPEQQSVLVFKYFIYNDLPEHSPLSHGLSQTGTPLAYVAVGHSLS